MDSLSRFVHSPLFGLLGLVLGIAGIAISYVLYYKSRRIRQPVWAIRSNNLVRDQTAKLPELSIAYRGKPVANLSVSKIAFWNQGRETIRREDVADADPLRS